MLLKYKYKLKPHKTQAVIISNWLSMARKQYNYRLALFKQSGGPIVAIAKIVNCWYYENLDYTDILWLKAKFNSLVLG
ncbi:MAG: helix-turn-helix domain-containing protein, partial [Okeania sp. SIO2D1]|nr:helix-turn-helix domain-containing protein [Okeania sp. SIO2D1]